MDASVRAQSGAPTAVAVMLTPAEIKEITSMLLSELATDCERALATPESSREIVGRLQSTIDCYAKQLEALEWGEPAANIEITCPADLLDATVHDLLARGEEEVLEQDVVRCAVISTLAQMSHQRRAGRSDSN